MIESTKLFDLGPYQAVCCRCGKPIMEAEQAEAVMVRVYVPSQDKCVDVGPFHKQCGQERQAEV